MHVKCLQRWRTSSPNKSAFFSCPQCHYKYKFAARFWAVGIASNPRRSLARLAILILKLGKVIIGCISAFIFALLTLASSYVTTYLLAYFQRPSSSGFYIFSSSYWFEDPVEAARDIVRAALGILQDENGVLFDARSRSTGAPSATTQGSPGFLARLIIGLPLLG